jgi:fructose-1-phosphate kinase PfkB-like protein
VLDASGSALRRALSRRPALVIPGDATGDPAAVTVPGPGTPAADGAAALVADGAGAVAILSGGGVRAVTAAGEWRAELAGQHLHRASRDAMVAGFVPGIALAWSWPDILAHVIALAASSDPAGDVDLEAYERLLPKVTVAP